jgi:DNA segregation ATPase FtsK/SpoIIIE-like protein
MAARNAKYSPAHMPAILPPDPNREAAVHRTRRQALVLLTVRPGMLETGQPWVIDLRVVPHWLNAGATQSGKSNLANAIIKGLSPQPVALIGFDLKGGVEFTPYAPRLSALATTRTE